MSPYKNSWNARLAAIKQATEQAHAIGRASQAKPRYRLHTDGTLSLIGGGLDAVCGQLTYVPKGHPSGLGGLSIYVTHKVRLVLGLKPDPEATPGASA